MGSVRLHCYSCQALRTVRKAGALVGRFDGIGGVEFGDTVENFGCFLTVGSEKVPDDGYRRWTLPVDLVEFARRLELRFHHDNHVSSADVRGSEHVGPGKWVVPQTHGEVVTRTRIDVQDPEDHRMGRMMYLECTPYGPN